MRGLSGKIILVAAIIILFAVFMIFELNQYMTLDYLKSSRTQLSHLYDVHPFAVIAVYMAGYIFATALSLPGATVLTLAGGALFGLGQRQHYHLFCQYYWCDFGLSGFPLSSS